jgi:hypothetical protein
MLNSIEALDNYKPPVQALSEKYIKILNNLGKRFGADKAREWLDELDPTTVIVASKGIGAGEELSVLGRAFSVITRRHVENIPFSDLGAASLMQGLKLAVEEGRIQIQDKPQA